jgi:hypothetical protein
MRVSEILRKGQAAIQAGWCQHAMVDADGAVCALGALGVALGQSRAAILDDGVRWNVAGATDAWELLNKTCPTREAIHAFNNARTTTHEDVIAWFDAAAAIAEQQEQHAAASLCPQEVTCSI